VPYNQPEEPLVERLKADATLTALVGTRIWPRWSKQDPDTPLIVFRRDGVEAPRRLDNAGTLKRYTLRLECYAETEALTHSPLKAAWESLDGFRDHTKGVQGVFHEDDDTGEDEASGLKFTARILSVWFQPVA
jgi:hypothetical protein